MKHVNIKNDSNGDQELSQRVERLERIVARHEALIPNQEESGKGFFDPYVTPGKIGTGAINFSGQFQAVDGSISFSWTKHPEDLIDNSWESSFSRLAALAHPQRAMILKQLLKEPCTVSELCRLEVTSSTGTAYHHLNDLEASGWVQKGRGGIYEIPSERIIPLLVIVSASENH